MLYKYQQKWPKYCVYCMGKKDKNKNKIKKCDPQAKFSSPRFNRQIKRDRLCGLKFFCRLKISTHPAKICGLYRLT